MRKSFHKVQAGRGVNSPGKPEIPEVLFEELLVTALMHQDYLISAPIRIFIFDNRIEIISPGSLPNNLTIEKIRNGNSNIRNPVLVSFIAKGLLPYRGLGSGIKRALEDWSDIDFIDDREGGLFTATIRRKEWEGSEKIISLMREEPELSAKEIAIRVDLTPRAIEKQIASLKKSGKIRRVGPAKGGHWEVMD
ncbi:MAG: winged helix-turn-helix transcriptional regulator [Methanospirillum sp.]|uniref:ATP-binding protein n=1 Tax=Methanospirillum sp. TaxID=45200 RepID=UPI0023710FAC|nr:ATP-binding protein [Methanospirillum sp.]MDD1727806.1 winged helix-turn-helix transcriptional regulator [Methanospirillum sp.]